MWGAVGGKKKLHLCKWDLICKPKTAGGLSLRYTKDSNLAFMTKLGWNLVQNRDELWVKVLRSKYKCGSDLIPSVSLKPGASNLWKGIVVAWPIVEDNLIWHLGNGQSIKFWRHNWVPQMGCLSNYATVNLLNDELEKTIADFVNSDGNWDWHRLMSFLPAHVCDYIAGIAPPSDVGVPDCVAWKCSHNGDFSIRSTYDHIIGTHLMTRDPLFKLIWKWKGMERIKVFLWQVAVDALPTNFFRYSRHVSDDPNGLRCNLHVHETSLHVLRDCPIAMDFWTRLICPIQYPHFYTAAVHSWLKWNLSQYDIFPGFSWPNIFASGVHYLWKIRNQEIFDLITPSQDDIFAKFWSVFRSQHLYSDLSNPLDRPVKNTSFISWGWPAMGWIKLNCDGSVLINRKASCGGLARDESGQFLHGFSVNLGICPITVAEIWGAFYALDMAWRQGHRRIVLELDSSSAISLIRKGVDNKHPYALVIAKVQELLKRDWVVHMNHIFKEGNRAADCMAYLGHSQQLGACFYFMPPSCVCSILFKDIVGVSLPRAFI